MDNCHNNGTYTHAKTFYLHKDVIYYDDENDDSGVIVASCRVCN